MRRGLLAAAVGAAAVGALVAVAAVGGSAGSSARLAKQGWAATPAVTVRLGWRPHRGPVPILMYHVIEPPRPGASSPGLYVGGGTFAAQMRWLDRAGFEAVTLDQVEDAWAGRGLLPPKPIVVSFDDGYRSHYTTAMPVLRRHGWRGVLSLTLGNMDDPDELITPTQVQGLVDAGWELDSHTISHADLRKLDGAGIRHELRDSRRIIRYVFRVPADNFTYPAGLYDQRAVAAARAAGYRGAMTVVPGLASSGNRFELKRIRVTDDMGTAGLAAALGP